MSSLSEKYEPSVIEPKWQKHWDSNQLFKIGQSKGPAAPKKYVLEMLPYPSGKMHMGHVRNYLLGDVYARFFRMKGFDVVHPMGWDAFGLPAENAAIKEGVHPATRTAQNIESFKAEILSLGYAYDWSLEVDTSKPEYYRWNQWFFLKMLEKGIVYRRFSKVNWCGVSVANSTPCNTVIANEQVKDGSCERCGSKVIDKQMPEWAFRITKYSQSLLDALDTLKEWPDRIVAAQRNWIGRSEGVEADFAVGADKLRVFTTRIDTVFGCTYVVVAPDHALVKKITTPEQKATVDAFVAKMAAQSKTERLGEDAEKEGVFTGAFAVNPFSGEKVPVWIANFVVSDYGTGAVMSVPGHDARDHAFATKYSLPVKRVIDAPDGAQPELPYTEDGVMRDSGPFTGLQSAEGRAKMAAQLQAEGKGEPKVTWRQKDWGFSRQRYWGTPIPILYCDKCDPKHEGIPVPYDQLPVRLPEIDTATVLTGKGEPPLAKVPSFVNVSCPKCGGPTRRETETMDTFVDSTWYFCRYLSPKFDAAPFDAEVAKRYLPVDIYVGGPEHATMHLLYFRFWYRVMRELGLTQSDEPVQRLITQGIVNGPDGRKMSKRWGNVVAPKELVQEYGADTCRTYVLFAGPPQQDFNWDDKQVNGAYNFLKRVWALAYKQHAACATAKFSGNFEGKALEIRKAAHKYLKRTSEAFERLSFNTAIAGAMEFVNTLYGNMDVSTDAEKAAMGEAIRTLAIGLTPIAPHICDEIHAAYGGSKCTVQEEWPAFDPKLVVDDTVTYPVSIQGKRKSEIVMPAAATEAEVRAAAEAEPKVQAALAGQTIAKVIFVPKKMINFVLGKT
ncbi:MAG: leucine--tRNA ligase [Myxococcaceae bacterium]